MWMLYLIFNKTIGSAVLSYTNEVVEKDVWKDSNLIESQQINDKFTLATSSILT